MLTSAALKRQRNRYVGQRGTVYFLYGNNVDQIQARHRSDSGLAFYLNDRMGSVRAITDDVGEVISTTDYSAYGEIISQTNPEKADQFGFTGREFDSETGLYCYRSRSYDPTIGAFISQDGTGFDAGEYLLYRYVVANSPHAFFDPYGYVSATTYKQIAVSGAFGLLDGINTFNQLEDCSLGVRITASFAAAGRGAADLTPKN